MGPMVRLGLWPVHGFCAPPLGGGGGGAEFNFDTNSNVAYHDKTG